MLISDLIKELHSCIQLYGDIEVYVRDDFGQLENSIEIIKTSIVKDADDCVIAIV